MQIKSIDNLNSADLEKALDAGGRFVFFEYCISLVVITLRRPSEIHLLRAGESGLRKGIPYSLISLLLGWWGIPWGIIYTPLTLITNLSGGRDVTAQVRALLARSQA